MILNDKQIKDLVATNKMVIKPFAARWGVPHQQSINKGLISYGISSFGYDLRAYPEWKIFSRVPGIILDPKDFNHDCYVDYDGDTVIIPPNSFVLTRSIEYIKMPEDVVAIAVGKSTYARLGIIANVTPIEPGWEGHVTLEFSNTTPYPAKMYANEGVVQLMFFKGERPDLVYQERSGKYQSQIGITLPRV